MSEMLYHYSVIYIAGEDIAIGDLVELRDDPTIVYRYDSTRADDQHIPLNQALHSARKGRNVAVKKSMLEIAARPWLVAADLGLYDDDQEEEEGMTPEAMRAWRERLVNTPTVITGDMAVWDDGYEQQGLYIKQNDAFIPLSRFLLAGFSDEDLWEGDFQLGKMRVTITFELLAEDDQA